MLALYLLLTAICILLIKYLRDFFNYRNVMNKLPGDNDIHPLLGNLHKHPGFKEDGIRWDYDNTEKYKYFHRFWAGPFSCEVFVYHPEAMREIIKKSIKPRNLSVIVTDYDMGVPWLGEGLVLSNGPLWHRNRRLLTPSFHFDVLKSYVSVYNSCANILLSKFREYSKTNASFNVEPLISNYTYDVILRCAFSLQTDIQNKIEPNEYIKTIHELSELWMKRYLNPLHHFEFIYKHLTSDGRKFHRLCNIAHSTTESIITSRQNEIDTEPGISTERKPRDFLDTLIRAKDESDYGLSFLEIRNEVDTFLFAGHDTTASATIWTLVSLAKHPQYQDDILKEVTDVLGERLQVTWDDLGKLQFTGQCIKEALRCHTAVPGITRVITEDIRLQGYHIPAGTQAFLQLWCLHNNPHVWDKPFEFNPHRFSPDNAAKMDGFQFIPFSAGSRNCIGQNFAINEIKLTICQIIRHFKLCEDKEKPALREYGLTMKSSTGAFVYATARQ